MDNNLHAYIGFKKLGYCTCKCKKDLARIFVHASNPSLPILYAFRKGHCPSSIGFKEIIRYNQHSPVGQLLITNV